MKHKTHMASNASAMNHIKVTFITFKILRRICDVETVIRKVLARAVRARERNQVIFIHLQLGGIYLDVFRQATFP